MPGKISFSTRRKRPKSPNLIGINQTLGLSALGGGVVESGVLQGRRAEASLGLLIDDLGNYLTADGKILYGVL